ncbi:diaminopimelate epimerase [Brenneria goodwinii]|uniref:hypothetical protein n=1 Tax=Brenneria goodwinii TaxID=1109412 RepID=UPI0036E4BF88
MKMPSNHLKLHTGMSNKNSFLIVDNREGTSQLPDELIPMLCSSSCDSLLLLESSSKADINMRILERDGSESDACINGCLLVWDYFSNNKKGSIQLKKKIVELYKDDNDIFLSITGEYKIQPWSQGRFLDMMDPHLVIKYDDPIKDFTHFAQNKQKEFGREVNVDGYFGIHENRVNIITYERGVNNLTMSCGSGALSTAIILHQSEMKHCDKINVLSSGGLHTVVFSENVIKIGTKRNRIKLEELW